jgi:hypothetical protein
MGGLHKCLHTFMTVGGRILLKMRNILDKVIEKIKTHNLRSINFSPKNLADYELMRKNMVQPETPEMTIYRALALCMLDKKGYKHALMIYNAYCFSTAVNAPECYVIRTWPTLFNLQVYRIHIHKRQRARARLWCLILNLLMLQQAVNIVTARC